MAPEVAASDGLKSHNASQSPCRAPTGGCLRACALLLVVGSSTPATQLTPDTLDTTALLAATQAALAAGIRWLQYRNKLAPAALRRAQASALRELTRMHGARLIVNDDPQLAAEVQADGVHLGRDDGSVAEARAHVGATAVVGVSAYDDFDRAQAAWRAGAVYVAFGSVFGWPRWW